MSENPDDLGGPEGFGENILGESMGSSEAEDADADEDGPAGSFTEDDLQALLKGVVQATLDITHHCVPPALVKELREALKCQLIAADPKEPEDEWRFIAHSE